MYFIFRSDLSTNIQYLDLILDLESIGSSLGINWELFGSGVEWSGPAIRPGLDNRRLIIEGHRGPLDFGFGIWDLDLGLDFGLKINLVHQLFNWKIKIHIHYIASFILWVI